MAIRLERTSGSYYYYIMIFFRILQCFIIFCGAEICSDQRGVSRLNLAARSKRASVRKFAALQTLRSHFCGFIVAHNEGGIFGRLANGEFTIIKSSGRKRKSQEGPFIFLPINLNFACVCAKGRGSGCAAPGRGSLLRGSKSGGERGGRALGSQNLGTTGLGLLCPVAAAGRWRGNGKQKARPGS